MAERLRRIGVLTHNLPPVTHATLEQLGAMKDELGVELLVPADEWRKHGLTRGGAYTRVDDAALRAADVCLVLGGDGTLLRALDRMLGSGVPTTGINFGNVGFLASMQQAAWPRQLREIVAGAYQLVDLVTVEARLGGKRYVAVNDIVLVRARAQRVLRLVYEVSGTTVGEMLCDGMIVASPTGSTAYNLSCNGPLVVWDAEALVLNFIAPHSIGFRPLVLRADHVIRVHNASPTEDADVMADGRVVARLCCGDAVEITGGSERARLLVREGGSFYHNVEEKLFDRHHAG